MQKARKGLSLVEVIAALVLFSIGALGLAGSSAMIVRQFSLNGGRAQSSGAARTRDETFHSVACNSLEPGSETKAGIRTEWTVVPGVAATLDQSVERVTLSGIHADKYLSAIPCD